MQLQHPTNNQQQLLPYQPIKFVYTQTIGSLTDKFKQIIDPYTWTYEDILQPRIVTSISKVDYYLFHIAPVYNWLRAVGSQVLERYLEGGNILKSKFSTNANKIVFNNFQQNVFLSEIKHYISQWEIVKLCACAKIKILTTKTDSKHQNRPNKNNKNITTNKTSTQQSQLICTHIIKKQKFTSSYSLNNFQPSNIRLECLKHYCEQCQRQVPIKCQIVKYPFAPYFEKYQGKDFVLDSGKGKKLEYQLTIVYGKEKTFLKSSGGVWYEVTKDKSSIVSFEKVELKSGLVFVYQQKVGGSKVLRKAQQLNPTINLSKKSLHELSNAQDDDSEDDQMHKLAKPLSSLLFSKPKPLPSSSQQPPNTQPEQQQKQILQQMLKVSLPVIMSKKHTDNKLFKEYKKTVQQLLPKPKQKDEYQRDYDKGKTKKIHKNKQVFRTADFFGLYNKIKSTPPVQNDGQVGEQNGEYNNQEKDYPNERNNQSNHEVEHEKADDIQNQDKFPDRRDRKFGDRKFGGRGGRHQSRGQGKFNKYDKTHNKSTGKSSDGKSKGNFNNRQGDFKKSRGGFKKGDGKFNKR